MRRTPARSSRALLVTLLLVGLTGCTPSAGTTALPMAAELQRILEAGVTASNGAGVTAAVVAAGYQPWTGAAGHSIRSSAGLVPMRAEMLFEIGSVAKNMVTSVVLQLVGEGRLSLDDPVSRWFPGYAQIPAEATVGELLASTSGIAEWVDSPASLFQPPFDPARLARSWTVDQMLTELVGPPEFAPGQGWRYSTTGFRLAREIAERVTGQPIAELIQTQLLDPAGITGMWLEPTWPIPPGRSVAHEWFDTNGDGNLDDITTYPKQAFSDLKSAPAYSDAIDLARYCQALFHDDALVSDAARAQMLTFRNVDDPREPMAASYGLGTGTFALPEFAGIEHYGHGGNGIGYVVAMLYLPQRQASVVIMTNDRGATMGTVAGAFVQAVDRGLARGPSLLFVGFGFLVQLLLVVNFAARLWRPSLERRYGWVVYALGLPAAAAAVFLLLSHAPWYEPLAFGLFAAWTGFGFTVDYVRRVRWRAPPLWPVFVPYVGLFIVSLFAFWLPLWSVGLGPWAAFGVLYALHTGLNLASHRAADGRRVRPAV